MNVLIVEDEKMIARSIKRTLSKVKIFNKIEIAGDFMTALKLVNGGNFEIILIDIFLGDVEEEGLELCRIIRERDNEIPIIVITGLNSIERLKKAFEYGVNEFITKPFDVKELELRVCRWLNTNVKVDTEKQILYRGLTYSFEANRFFFDGNPLDLTRKNKILLLMFMRLPEKLLTKGYIQEKYFGDLCPDQKNRNLRSTIQCLRTALSPDCDQWIKTVRGEGYMLKK